MNSMIYKAWVNKYKLHLRDMKFTDARAKGYHYIQPKYDGFWCLLAMNGRRAQVVSAGGEVRLEMPYYSEPALLVAEWLFGTTWGNAYSAKTGLKFAVHDIVEMRDKDLTTLPYYVRHDIARVFLDTHELEGGFLVHNYPFNEDNWRKLWSEDFEGVVFKYHDRYYGAEVGRAKHTFSWDYVFMGCNPGTGKYAGTAGSIKGGLFIDGEYKHVCSVGGLTDWQRDAYWENQENLYGMVFEAEGKQLFASGALRHPTFKRWRSDKSAAECILPPV